MSDIKTVTTPDLVISYHDHGPASGWPVILSHGFPYAPCLFDAAIPFLASRGARVIVPYLRGFGPTAFRSADAPRSGQQAALGSDLMALADALFPESDGRKPIVAGFDWGGVASCTAAALWPGRVAGLVSYAGYDVVDVAAHARPSDPSLEAVMWYQHLVSFFYNPFRSLDWVFNTIILNSRETNTADSSKPSADATASATTAATCATCSGGSGRPAGAPATTSSTAPPPPLTTRTLSTSSSTPTGSASASSPASRSCRTWRFGWPRSQRYRFR